MKPLRIVIADDESLHLMSLRAHLETLGHRVVGEASDGKQAIDQGSVGDGATHEGGRRRNVLLESAAQIVQHSNCVPSPDQMFGHVRSDKACAACNKNVAHVLIPTQSASFWHSDVDGDSTLCDVDETRNRRS